MGAAAASFFRWLAGNWAGLSAGWALSDILSPAKPGEPAGAAAGPKEKNWIQSTLGVPGYVASLIILVIAFLIFKRFIKNK